MPEIVHQTPKSQPDSLAASYYPPAYPGGFSDTLQLSGTKTKQLTDYPVLTTPAGKEPEYYQKTPVRTSGTLILLVVSFLLVAFCYKGGKKYLSHIFTDAWSVKRTKNHLDDHTLSETFIMLALILQTIITEGIILYYATEPMRAATIENRVSINILISVAVAGTYYLWQLFALKAIGYIFSDKSATSLWIQGFNATQSIMGLALAPVAVVMLFVSELNGLMLLIAVSLYSLARIVFLIKGFRIFFNHLFQCVYFISYLCAVEIVPLFLLYNGAYLVYNYFELGLL